MKKREEPKVNAFKDYNIEKPIENDEACKFNESKSGQNSYDKH